MSRRKAAPAPFNFEMSTATFYVFMVVSLLLILDPLYTGHGAFRVSRDLGPIKYVGLVAGMGALFISGIAIALNSPASSVPWRATLGRAWPLLLFASLVTAGSLWARIQLGIKETYLQLGMGMLGLPIAVIVFWATQDKLKIPRRFLQLLLIAVPYVLAWIVLKRLQGGQAFHTEIFLFVPLLVYFFLALKRRWLAWGILLLCIVTGLAGHKNTAYLVTLLAMGHLGWVIWLQGVRVRDLTRRAMLWFLLIVLVASTIALVGFLFVNRETYLPSGNVEARAFTYSEAIQRFLSSPIYGTAFADTGLVQLSGREILGRSTVVSHSDFFDILSHGGVIGALLFAVGITGVLKRALGALRLAASEEARALIHGLIALIACGLVTAAFNSPLISLPIALLFWFAVGLLGALTEHQVLGARSAVRSGRDTALVPSTPTRHDRRPRPLPARA